MSDSNRGEVAVSIVIPVFNDQDTLPPLLDSIMRQTVAPDEIIVVDDGSTDSSVAFASAYKSVSIVRLAENSGPSMARNKGVEASTKDVILFLDSDVVLSANAVAVTKRAFSDRPELVAMNGVMEKEPLNPNLFSRYKALVEYAWAHSMPSWDSSSKCFNARVGAIRRQAILEVGGFDPAYRRPSVEDHEFGLRLVRHYPIYLNHELTAFHHFSGFFKTILNYYERTKEYIELMSSNTHQSPLDKGGASVGSATEFLLGTFFLASLFLLIWGILWVPLLVLSLFAIVSARSLKFHWKFRSPFFFLFSLVLHSIYGSTVIISAVKTWIWLKCFGWRSGPVPLIARMRPKG